MRGELYINGKDAYDTWGISLSDSGLSALMTPAPNKEYIENKSRLGHGKSVINNNVRIDERNITLPIHLTASNKNEFFSRYSSFCEELAKGYMEIMTSYQPNVLYRMYYISCNQFSQFMHGIGKFSLKLNEPDPTDRNL